MASHSPVDVVPPSVEADLTANSAVAAGHETGGLPQFDFAPWAGQIVYLLFLFVVLYLLISKVFAPRYRRVLDARAETIGAAVTAARQVQAEAADQQQAARAEVARARTEARGLAAGARAKAAQEAQARRAAEDAQVAARVAEAEASIARTREDAMRQVSGIARDTAGLLVERLTGRAADPAELNGAA